MKLMMMTLGVLSLTATSAFAASERPDREAFHAAMKACAQEAGLPAPEPGKRPKRPNEEQRTKLEACMKGKGFEKPDRPPHGHGSCHEREEQQEG